MSGAEGNGKPLLLIPKTVIMNKNTMDASLSSDPADARRRLPGKGGVKSATGHASVTHQAAHGNSVSGDKYTINSRHPHRIGTWNVQGLNQPGKLQIVENEMERKEIQILGLSETHWRGQGHFYSNSRNKVFFSGPDDESSRGVAFIVPPLVEKCVLGYKPVNDRIIAIRLNTKPCTLNIVQVYAPTAQSSEDEMESFYGTLAATLKEIPKREITIILGDFNAKVGETTDDNHLRRIVGKYGIGERNERGERLLQFCSEESLFITNTCFRHHIRRLYTWISPGDRYRNQIDYVLIGSRWRTSVMNTITFPGADCGSDHQLLVTTLRIRLKRLVKPKANPNLQRVDLAGYKQSLTQRIANESYEGSGSVKWDLLKSVISEVANKHIIKKQPMKNYITSATSDIIMERRELKEKGTSSAEDQAKYTELSRDVQRRCRQDYNAHIRNMCVELEQHSVRSETKDLFRKVRELAGTRITKTCIIEDESGNLLTDTSQVLDRWKRYCAALYDTGNPTSQGAQWIMDEPDILRSEVENAIKALKCGKAPGKDGIPAELLKNMGDAATSIMVEICNDVWRTGKWPVDWTESVFIPLHKKGSTRSCGNYRTIALISHASKILLHILNQRLHHFLKSQIPEEQAGFVKGKGTREQLLNIRQVIEKSREFNCPVVLCFIDYTKAFDCVQWDKLWTVLHEMGTPEHLVGLIRHLYVENRSFVRIGTDCSNVFETKKGVRQGCILSPGLFNIYGEYIVRKVLESWDKGFAIGGKRISNLRYADDTVLLASSVEDMQELFQRLETESNCMGLAVNKSKTKIMVVDRAGKLPSTTNIIPGVDVVDHYVYLGALIYNDGSCAPEIKRRIGMAKDAMTRLSNIWKRRGITNATKIRLIRALIFPIFLYGVETWTIRARERQRIEAFEMWCWRRMLRIPWTARRTNASILSQLRVQTRLSTICQQRILSYFGHIVRKGDHSLEKLIVVGNTEGKRARGRSPTRWCDQVKAPTSSKFYSVVREAMDRHRWKQVIQARSTTAPVPARSDDHDPQP